MFKKILVITACLLSATSYAEAYKDTAEVVCAPMNEIFKSLSEDYGETPILIGKSDTAAMLLWASKTTKTFTVVASDGKDACVLFSGNDLKPFMKKNNL